MSSSGGAAPVKTSSCSLFAKIAIGVTVTAVVVVGAACAGYFLTVSDSDNTSKATINLNATNENQTTFAPGSTASVTANANDQTTLVTVGEGQTTTSGEGKTQNATGGQSTTFVGGQTGQTNSAVGQTTGAVVVGQTTGGQTSSPVVGEQTSGSVIGLQTTGIGGQTLGSATDGQTTENIIGEQTTVQAVGGQTTGDTINSGISNSIINSQTDATPGQTIQNNPETSPGGTITEIISQFTSPDLPAETTTLLTTTSPTTSQTTAPETLCPPGLSRTVIFSQYGGAERVWLRGANVDITHRSVDDVYDSLAVGDTKLDWGGREPGQVEQALGTPTAKTNDPINTFGENYRIMNACIDCTLNNRFEFKMFTNNWENLNAPNNNCVRNNNHLGECGKLNVFTWGSGDCQINDF